MGESEVEIEIPWIVDQVKVIQAGEFGGAGRIGRAGADCVDELALPAHTMAGLAPDGQRADRLEDGAIGGHRRRLRVVVRR